MTTAPGRIQSSAEAVIATNRRDPYVAETIASIGYPAMSKAVVSVGIGGVPA